SRQMRLSLILMLLILSNVSSGQDWEYRGKRLFKKYGHEYAFQFRNEQDSASFLLKRVKGEGNSTIFVNDVRGDTIRFANVTIENEKNHEVFRFTANWEGLCRFKIPKGHYKVTVSDLGYDFFSKELEVKDNEHLEIVFTLSLGPELITHVVNSRKKLTGTDLMKIIECIRTSRRDERGNCIDQEECILRMEF
ncbi:MAG: carboxypeptidase-like regulatory domain-containing protein, partial [Bacteroidota bacterium]